MPKDALVLGAAAPMVFVADVDGNARQGKARGVLVKLGLVSGNAVEVTGGLRPGELVVVEGNERLRDGQEIAVSSTAPAASVSDAKDNGSPKSCGLQVCVYPYPPPAM